MREKEDQAGLASRLLNGTRGFIWEEDPTPRKGSAAAAGDKAGSKEKSAANAAEDVVAPGDMPSMNGMGAELLAVIMNRPTAYSALAEAISALAHIPMDEATRYRCAFAVLKQTQQRSVEQVAQAVEVHLALLETEIGRFKGQSKTAEDSEITARVNEAAALDAAVEQAGRQIDRLRADTQARIEQLQEELQKKQVRARELTDETEERKRLILQTTKNFEEAVEAVKATLAREKSKIAQYLQ